MFNMINETVAVETRCPFCGKTAIVEVPTDGFIAWHSGATVQRAFPNLDTDTRERLVSGICPTCWDKMFSVPDDDEDEEDYDDCDYEMGFDPYLGCFSDDC